MKKLVAWLVVISIYLGVQCCALADDLGVVIITPGDEEQTAEAGTLDNLKLKTPVEVPDYATITPTAFEFIDKFYGGSNWSESGVEADYAFFRMDILNQTSNSVDYLDGVLVKVIFMDKVEYAGWARQYSYNNSETSPLGRDKTFAIDPFYVGHYVFGCTLPNAVINQKDSSLKMIITLGDIEMTYIIR